MTSSNITPRPVNEMIAIARHDGAQPGPRLERYCAFLLVEGQQRFGAKLAARCDTGAALQERLSNAFQRFDPSAMAAVFADLQRCRPVADACPTHWYTRGRDGRATQS